MWAARLTGSASHSRQKCSSVCLKEIWQASEWHNIRPRSLTRNPEKTRSVTLRRRRSNGRELFFCVCVCVLLCHHFQVVTALWYAEFRETSWPRGAATGSRLEETTVEGEKNTLRFGTHEVRNADTELQPMQEEDEKIGTPGASRTVDKTLWTGQRSYPKVNPPGDTAGLVINKKKRGSMPFIAPLVCFQLYYKVIAPVF